jgi:hypothetical protein
MTMAPPSQLAEVSSRVEVRFGTTQPQRRWTVLIRFILVIPQYFVLFFVGVGAVVVAFLGWLAALFTGRLPASFAKFLLGYVRWTTRVYAYSFLMTDVYPPFALDPDPSYPVDLTVTTGRLNRAAVFFRIILVIPAGIVSSVITYGMEIFALITWIATLVTGRMPDAFFGATAAAIRWQARTHSYFWMLTSYYPSDLLGDKDAWGKRMDGTVSGTVVPPPAGPTPIPAVAPFTQYAPFGGPTPTPAWGADQPTVAAPVAPPPFGAMPPPPPPPLDAPPPPPPGALPPEQPSGVPSQEDAQNTPAVGPLPIAPPPPIPGAVPPTVIPGAVPPPPPAGAVGPMPGTGVPPPPPGAMPPPPPPYTPGPIPPPPPPGPYPMTGYSPSPQSLWPLALTKGARVLSIIFIVLGAVTYVGFNSLGSFGSVGPFKGIEQALDRLQVQAAHDNLTSATDTFRTATQQCESQAEPIQCLDQAASSLAGAFQTYGNALSRINYPSSANAQAGAAESAAQLAYSEITSLSQAVDIQAYSQTAQSRQFASSLQAVDTTYNNLYGALGG